MAKGHERAEANPTKKESTAVRLFHMMRMPMANSISLPNSTKATSVGTQVKNSLNIGTQAARATKAMTPHNHPPISAIILRKTGLPLIRIRISTCTSMESLSLKKISGACRTASVRFFVSIEECEFHSRGADRSGILYQRRSTARAIADPARVRARNVLRTHTTYQYKCPGE